MSPAPKSRSVFLVGGSAVNLWAWLLDPNLQWVMMGSVFLGISSGALGAFTLLRRRSLMGDVLAHAALPGICLAFLLTGSKSIGILMLGAVFSGLLATLAVNGITRYSRIKEDTALGLILTVFFGIGILLLTQITHTGASNQAGLDKFLFGQAASMVASDVQVMAAVAALLCLVVVVMFHEFKLVCFDPQFGKGLGRPVALLDNVLMLLIVGAVVIGLQAVGVVLMAAMLITPAIAARYWTERLPVMVVVSAVFGALSGIAGTVISTTGAKLSTGPLIVLAATAFFLASLLFAPGRGLVAKVIRHLSLRARVERENILRALFELQEVEVHAVGADRDGVATPTGVGVGIDWSFTPADLAKQRGESPARLGLRLKRLSAEGLVRPVPASEAGPNSPRYALTEQGVQAAYEVVRRHRLWEMFLMYEAELGVDHVDRDADLLEHHLPDSVVAQLERLLRLHKREPVLPASVHPITSDGGRESWTTPRFGS